MVVKSLREYIEKAAVLVEALPYIQSFRNKTVVIKYAAAPWVRGLTTTPY
jgi:acetylglutamate kinase